MTTQAFSERIVGMQDTLYRVTYSILSEPFDREDAVQTAIQKAWQKQAMLRDDRYMQTWVIRILLNECYALLRKRRREMPTESMPERVAPPDADPFWHELLFTLKEELRIPLVLHYVIGYPIELVAKMLHIPQGTVKSRLSRARTLLRDHLSAQEVQNA